MTIKRFKNGNIRVQNISPDERFKLWKLTGTKYQYRSLIDYDTLDIARQAGISISWHIVTIRF